MTDFESSNGTVSEEVKTTEDALDIIRDPEFISWFNGSVVVDSDGGPKIMYHGSKSSERFTEFKTEHDDSDLIKKPSRIKIKSSVSKGVYFTDNLEYITELVGEGKQVYKVYLAIKNPLLIEGNVTNDQISLERVKELQEQGFDGIKTTEGGETFIAFDSDQIYIIPEAD